MDKLTILIVVAAVGFGFCVLWLRRIELRLRQCLLKLIELNAQKELLPMRYVHVVFTLPAQLAPLALQNKKLIYGLLLRVSPETLLEVARDPRHLGAEIGFFSVLHTWSQKLTQHPHVHCVIPAGGLSPDHTRWVKSQNRFFLPLKVLSRVFRGKFVAGLKRYGEIGVRGGQESRLGKDTISCAFGATKAHSQEARGVRCTSGLCPVFIRRLSGVTGCSSAVGFAAMTDAANLDGVWIGADEEEPVVANAQPKLFSSLEGFHVARARFRKAMQRGKNVHGGGLAETADIGLSGIGPDDPLHFGS
jgi:Putative transposase